MESHQLKYIQAGNPDTPVEQLLLLAQDELDHVRRRVGENHMAPCAVLIALACDWHPDVRIAVSENPSCPADVLERLAGDEHVDVRFALAENPNLPPAIIAVLVDDENPYVSHRARRTLRSLEPPGEVHEWKARPYESGSDNTLRDVRYR